MAVIVHIDKQSFKKFQQEILDIELSSFITPWRLPQFIDELSNPYSHIWGLVENDALIGYICFWIIGDEIHILNLAIRPDMRGKGMAKLLLKKLIEMAKEKDISNIWLEVRISNNRAISLYKSIGFEKVGIRKGYYSDTHEDAIIMALNLKK